MQHLRNLLFLLLVPGLWSLVPSPVLALNDVYVVQFVLDGVHKDFLHSQIENGNLPNLKSYFFDKGAVFDKAITTFPTVSSPGYVSFVTGLSAGNSGIFFLEWFDRTKQKVVSYLTATDATRINQDLLNRLQIKNPSDPGWYSPTTLFEKLAPEPTAAIYTPFRKGATIASPKKFPLEALWNGLITKDGLQLNKLAMEELKKVFSKPAQKIPRYTLIGLYGTDFYGHQEGPDSEACLLVLKQFDSLFEKFTQQLEKQGLSNKTYFVLSSDHGMHATGGLLNLRDYLWKKGITRHDNIYLSNRGVSSTFIYTAGEEGWEDLPTLNYLRNFPSKKGRIDLVQTLLDLDEIDWVAVRENLDRVRLFDREGEGTIVSTTIGNQTFYSYTYKNHDPLGFAAIAAVAPLLNGTPLGSEEWFQKTSATNRPNAVVELSRLFQDPKAGDILVVAKDAWSFRKAKAGTHGSLSKDDMDIPLWVAGPDIPQGRFGPVKSVDLFPTVLSWFGILNDSDLANQEGKPFFAKEIQEEKGGSVSLWLAKLEQELMQRPPLSKLPDRYEVMRHLKEMVPKTIEKDLLGECKKEIERRYSRLKKFGRLKEDIQNPKNPLEVAAPSKHNMEWLLTHEQNIEFMRLKRMEDVKSILENP